MVRDARVIGACLGVLLAAQGAIALGDPQGTAFTYQGQLKQSGVPVDGTADFMFTLHALPSGGLPFGMPVTLTGVDVIDGLFTVQLDFGALAFHGDARWLNIQVRYPAGGGLYTTLTPRQPLNAAPYALYALNGPGGGGDTVWAANGEDIYATNTGNVGIGTTTPAAKLHVAGSAPVLRLQDDDDPASYTWIVDSSPGQMGLFKSCSAGSMVMDINPCPLDGVSDAAIRFFRSTNTTGQKLISFLTGNGTNVASGYIGVGGSPSCFQLDGGDFGIGVQPDGARLHVGGTARIMATDLALNVSALYGDDLRLEDADAVLSLYSSPGGNYGSAFGLAEINAGDLVDKWTLYRTTSGATPSSQLRFSFGSNANYSSNPVRLALSADGKVGIGTTAPQATLDVAGDVRISGAVDIDGPAIVGGLAFVDGDAVIDGAMSVYGNVMVRSASTGVVLIELGEGLDYAEGFDVSKSDEVTPGMVLVIDPANPGKLTLSTQAYDRRVAGIVAGARGLGSAVRLGAGRFDHDVALAGRVYCQVDATEHGIEPGDLLTTSALPGHAMKVTDPARAQGAILGKAMQPLKQGATGQILVLVTLQ